MKGHETPVDVQDQLPKKKRRPAVLLQRDMNQSALVKELREIETQVDSLKRVKRYQEKNEEVELRALIDHWRSVAQAVTNPLLEYCRDHFEFMEQGLVESPSPWGDEQRQKTFMPEAQTVDQDDDMSRLLTMLRIDKDLIHYSSKLGDFY